MSRAVILNSELIYTLWIILYVSSLYEVTQRAFIIVSCTSDVHLVWKSCTHSWSSISVRSSVSNASNINIWKSWSFKSFNSFAVVFLSVIHRRRFLEKVFCSPPLNVTTSPSTDTISTSQKNFLAILVYTFRKYSELSVFSSFKDISGDNEFLITCQLAVSFNACSIFIDKIFWKYLF